MREFPRFPFFVLCLGLVILTGGGCSEGPSTATVSRLSALGARVDFSDSGEIVFVNLSGTEVTDDDLRLVAEIPTLQRLWLHDTQISDRGLRYLSGASELRQMVLGETAVTDEGLPNLLPLRKLEELYVYGSRVSGEGAQRLRDAIGPQLKVVY